MTLTTLPYAVPTAGTGGGVVWMALPESTSPGISALGHRAACTTAIRFAGASADEKGSPPRGVLV